MSAAACKNLTDINTRGVKIMRKAMTKLIAAVGISVLAATAVVHAQSQFDPKQFFEDLGKQGAKMPNGFDPQKFFEDLGKQGAADKKFDPKEFFENLQKQGATLPAGFDPQKFFEELQKQGGKMPPMVKVK